MKTFFSNIFTTISNFFSKKNSPKFITEEELITIAENSTNNNFIIINNGEPFIENFIKKYNCKIVTE